MERFESFVAANNNPERFHELENLAEDGKFLLLGYQTWCECGKAAEEYRVMVADGCWRVGYYCSHCGHDSITCESIMDDGFPTDGIC